MNDKTIVVFRRWPNGDVIAIFPELPATNNDWWFCQSYMHVGQHSACNIDIMKDTSAANKNEYQSLFDELTSIGYELIVRKNIHQSYTKKRKQNWKKQ